MSTVTGGRVEEAAAWRLLALGFTPPTAETLEEVAALADALAETRPSPELDALVHAVSETTPDRAAAQFAALFRGGVLVAPYEGSYEVDPIRQGRQMADVAAFYRAFGAEAQGPGAERPDFVGCELEFLSFLELRALAAEDMDEPGREIVADIRAAFLEDHAGRWLPAFFDEVRAAASDAPLYRSLADLGATVLARELAFHALEPGRAPRRGPSTSLDADQLECGASQADLPM